MTPKLYLVGGTVRDYLLNRVSTPKDIDFAVEADSYEQMVTYIKALGGDAYLERPQYASFRGSLPYSMAAENFAKYIGVRKLGKLDADFTLCRVDGFYTDHRHPDTITPGPLADDLKRRDFTMNAMAIDEQGNLIDPHGGQAHIRAGRLYTVGDTDERFEEDPLRILRALRFAITHDMLFSIQIQRALTNDKLVSLMSKLPYERIYEEVKKMFKYDTLESIQLLYSYPDITKLILDGNRIWLKPMME